MCWLVSCSHSADILRTPDVRDPGRIFLPQESPAPDRCLLVASWSLSSLCHLKLSDNLRLMQTEAPRPERFKGERRFGQEGWKGVGRKAQSPNGCRRPRVLH